MMRIFEIHDAHNIWKTFDTMKWYLNAILLFYSLNGAKYDAMNISGIFWTHSQDIVNKFSKHLKF